MDETKTNTQPDKPAGNPMKPIVNKPATGSSRQARTTAKPAPSRSTGPETTPASKTTTTGPAKTTPSRSVDESPAKPSAKKPADILSPSEGEAPGLSTGIAEKKSKKLTKALKKLKIQKNELDSLEKSRDRLMKNLISAIEKKKKSKRIRSLARDFNRMEKRVQKKTASYVRANKKLNN